MAAVKVQEVPIGSTVVVGNLKYTVFQTEWKDSLPGDLGARTPRDKFMIVHVAVENATATEAGIPLMTLVNGKGESINEEQDGKGLPEWMGYLRTVAGKGTERGTVLFDAPQTSYKLKLMSSDDPETEQTAMVDIPLSIELTTPQNAPGPAPGANLSK